MGGLHLLLQTPELNLQVMLPEFIVLGTALGAGVAIGRSLRSTGALVVLAVTASIVDVISFSSGPTRWLLEADSGAGASVLRFLTISVPREGVVVPAVGVGDLLLLAAFFVALRALNRGRLVALAVGLWRGGAFGIPFMAAGAVALVLPRKVEPVEGCPA